MRVFRREFNVAQRQGKHNVADDVEDGSCGLVVHGDGPLYAIPDPDDPTVTRYFSTDEEADAYFGPESVDRALALAGVWSDLDWDEAERELYRIGHSTPPSTPLPE